MKKYSGLGNKKKWRNFSGLGDNKMKNGKKKSGLGNKTLKMEKNVQE